MTSENQVEWSSSTFSSLARSTNSSPPPPSSSAKGWPEMQRQRARLQQEVQQQSTCGEMSPLSTCVRLEAMDELERENMELRRSLGGAESEADELRDEVKKAQAQAESAARQRDGLQRELAVLRQQVQEVKAQGRTKVIQVPAPVRNDESKEQEEEEHVFM